MDLIPHDWMIGNTYLTLKLIIEKSLLRHYTCCLPNESTWKLKDFQKASTNKEI